MIRDGNHFWLMMLEVLIVVLQSPVYRHGGRAPSHARLLKVPVLGVGWSAGKSLHINGRVWQNITPSQDLAGTSRHAVLCKLCQCCLPMHPGLHSLMLALQGYTAAVGYRLCVQTSVLQGAPIYRNSSRTESKPMWHI